MGLLRPSAGRASILGRDCHADAVALKREVGYLPDEPFLYPYLTGLETLELVGGLHGIARRRGAPPRGATSPSASGLGAAARAYTVTYSLGMKKRLALALALIHEPRVLILDEPTNGLDPAGARQMRATIAEYAAGGRTIFLSTHLLDAAERLCHRVAIIQKGRLQAVGTPDELRARFAAAPGTTLEDLFLRVTSDDAAAPATTSARRRRRLIAAQPIGAGPLAALLIRSRLRSFRNGLRARGSRRTPVLATVAGLVIALAYVGLFSQAFSAIVGAVGLVGQAAALALVTGTLALGSLTAKAASSDAVRAGSAENEFLLARPVSLPALVAARGLADAVTDPMGALFLFPVLVAAALVWRLPPAAWLLAAAISSAVQVAISMLAYATQLAVVRGRRAGAPADGLDGRCAWWPRWRWRRSGWSGPGCCARRRRWRPSSAPSPGGRTSRRAASSSRRWRRSCAATTAVALAALGAALAGAPPPRCCSPRRSPARAGMRGWEEAGAPWAEAAPDSVRPRGARSPRRPRTSASSRAIAGRCWC